MFIRLFEQDKNKKKKKKELMEKENDYYASQQMSKRVVISDIRPDKESVERYFRVVSTNSRQGKE